MSKGSPFDPRGLIYESYRIDGIDDPQCRSIFMDWALGAPEGQDHSAALQALLDLYGEAHPDHPMTVILREGISTLGVAVTKRKGGRRRKTL